MVSLALSAFCQPYNLGRAAGSAVFCSNSRSNAEHAYALDSVAIGRSRVLPGRELVIERGNLVQPFDDRFVGHRSCVATSSFRFLPEERGVGRSCGVRQPLIHVILTFARHGTIRIPKSDRVNRTSLVEPIIEVLSGKAPDGAAGIERRGAIGVGAT